MNSHSSIGSHRANAIAAGVCYIVATVAAITAVVFYGPSLFEQGQSLPNADRATHIITGVFCDLLVVCSAAGTGIMLFPYIRRYNESLGLVYLCFRWFEALIILVGLTAVLTMLSLSQELAASDASGIQDLSTSYLTLKAIHAWTMILGPNFLLGINTFTYSLVFHRTGLVHRQLAIFGVTAATLIFIAALLELYGVIEQVSVAGAMFAFPIFLYEMILAARLIAKGFNNSGLQMLFPSESTDKKQHYFRQVLHN